MDTTGYATSLPLALALQLQELRTTAEHALRVVASHAPSVADRLSFVARRPGLIIASDFDGTLCEHVELPGQPRMEQLGLEALARLSQMRHTLVAIVSGRGLGSLRAAMNDSDDRLSRCVLVGSHGAEWSSGPLPDLQQKGEQVDRLFRAVHALAAAHAGAFAERKPLGVALHVRGVPDADEQRRVLALGQRLLMEAGDVRIRRGILVVEGSVAHVGKDDAVRSLRAMKGQDWPDSAQCSVVALGDDVTDEDAFQLLHEEDLGIKVGEGPTLARSRVGSAPRACEALWALALIREAYLSEEHGKTIEGTAP